MSRSERTWPEGVEGVTGDLDDPESLVRAADGVEAVFLLSGYAGTERLLEAVRAAGGTRAVLLSSSSAPSGDETNAVAKYHIEAERTVRDSGLEWTMLQPNSFMANALQWAPQLASGDVVRGPFGSVAGRGRRPRGRRGGRGARAHRSGHAGQAYRLSGPEALRPEQQVAILGRVLGRDLRWEGWSDEQARTELESQMPTPYVDAFFSFFVDGLIDETTVQPTVPELLGRPARSFETWARAHAERSRAARRPRRRARSRRRRAPSARP